MAKGVPGIYDAAKEILSPLQIDNSLKADAWEAFNSSKNEAELQVKLMAMKDLPQTAKADLWEAKHQSLQGAPMGNGPNVRGLIADPEFQWLSPSDKRLTLQKVTGNADFASLSDAETMQFISRFNQGTPIQDTSTISARPSLGQRLWAATKQS